MAYANAIRVLLAGLLIACLSGCAGQAQQAQPAPVPEGQPEPTVVAHREYHDPLIRVNRAVFAFNDVVYRYAMIPIAEGYQWLLPQPVRNSIGNAFHNIKMPIRSINYLAQGKAKAAGIDVTRFVINTTIGLAGLFDPAANWFSLDRSDNSFEQTVNHYGGGYGLYLVLPFLGPSDLRNGSAVIADYVLNPIPYMTSQPDTTLIMAADQLQSFGPQASRYEKLRAASDDPYLFFRNLYLQSVQRDAAYEHANCEADGESNPC